MNKLSLTLAALAASGLCSAAKAGLFSDKFEMLVVAERAADAPEASGTIAAALVDGGYIEAGDPIAGENPPSAASVRQELQDAHGQRVIEHQRMVHQLVRGAAHGNAGGGQAGLGFEHRCD